MTEAKQNKEAMQQRREDFIYYIEEAKQQRRQDLQYNTDEAKHNKEGVRRTPEGPFPPT